MMLVGQHLDNEKFIVLKWVMDDLITIS